MIKEWVRDFCGYDFLKDMYSDIKYDITKLTDKCNKLTDTYSKADIANQNAIRFILHNMDIDKNIFQEYKYFKFKDVPWYIQELLLTKYNIQVKLDIYDSNTYLYYKQQLIGSKGISHIGELLDSIEKIDKESLNVPVSN